MRRVAVLVIFVMAAAACSSSSKPAASQQPSSTPPTSPVVTSTTARSRAGFTTSTTALPILANVHVTFQRVASGLNSPVALAWRHGDARAYVAEQSGDIRIVDTSGRVVPTPVLSVPVSHGNEQGMLGVTFSGDGTKIYVHYDDPNGDSNIVEYAMRGDIADASTRRVVLFQKQPYANHNGGEVVLGPDGMLYIGLGDGGSEGDPNNEGQNLGTLLSKILRINPKRSGSASYTVPADNPFVRRGGVRPETWMWGLRNPWRFSFDRVTHDMWIGDVGQNKYEEIDFAPAGQSGMNWGWSLREGFHKYKGAQPRDGRDPIIEAAHTDGYCAIVGGYVYRGRAIPALYGVYLYGDNCNSSVTGAVTANGKLIDQRKIGQIDSLTTFGEDNDGELYAASRSGTIFKLVAG